MLLFDTFIDKYVWLSFMSILQIYQKGNHVESKEKLAPPQSIVALPQTEKVGLSLPSQSLLLLFCPLPPLCCCSSTCSKPPQAIKEAPSLASHTL